MSSLTEQLTGLGYQAGWQLLRYVPEQVARGLFEAGADRAARRNKAGTRQLRRNLARVVPKAGEAELDELIRDALRSYARYWCEAFRLPAMDISTLLPNIEIAGREYLDAALAEGNGAVVALPHTGNFDVVGVWAVHHYDGLTTVAQRLRPESLYRRFVAYRESLGMEILPLTGGESSTARTLLARLRANRIVCLVSERDITETGVPVTFFGEQTSMPAGPARLAAATGAALLPLGAWFTDTGWGYRIHPPIRLTGRAGVGAATQALADVFAGDIAAHPADWHLMQPLWPADLSERSPVLATQE